MASKKLPQSITCKAAVAWGPGEALKMEEVQVAPPQALEVRIKVVSTSLCRSDITFFDAQISFPAKHPIKHEIVVIMLDVSTKKTHTYAVKTPTCLDIPVQKPLGSPRWLEFHCAGQRHICWSIINGWEGAELIGVINQGHIPIFPRIFGHEATGIIESVGEDVIDLHEGDHVLTVFTGECKECAHCKSDKSNMCETLRMERKGVMHSDQKTRFSINGKPIYHFCAVSSFSEYTIVHSGCIVKLSLDIPLGKICVLGCGVATGFGAAWKVANIEAGSTIVIFGLGTVGLSVAQGAKLRGASRIIGVDINPEKYGRGKAFGITEFINPNDYKQPIQQVLREITAGGADYCFECVGNVDVIRTALESCCDGWGLAVVVGVPSGKMELSAHYGSLLSGRTLKGTLLGGWKPRSELPILVDMYLKKEIQVDEYVTHELPFSEINKAYELMREGNCLRCVMHM